MMFLGTILFLIGVITWLGGELRLLVVAYRHGLGWLLGCLFIPFACWVFFLLNVKQAWKPVVTATIGFALTSLGYWVGGFQYLQWYR